MKTYIRALIILFALELIYFNTANHFLTILINQTSEVHIQKLPYVVAVLAISLHKQPKLWTIAAGFIGMLAKLCDGLHLPLNSERLQKLTENYEVSNLKIKTALNTDLPVNTRSGLLITAKSFKRKN